MNELAIIGETDLQSMLRVAHELAGAGGMLPRHLRQPGEILAVIMTGRELGLGPMAAIRGVHLVQGKAVLDYSLMVALLRRRGYRVEWLEKSETVARLRLTHPTDGTTHEETYTIERANRAKLTSRDIWKAYPEAMLSARCVSSAARAFAADVLSGCYERGEAAEIAGEVTVQVAPERVEHRHSYDDPEHAEAAETAIKIAEGFVAKHLAPLEECARVTREEFAAIGDGDEAEIAAARQCHERAIHDFWALNAAEWRDAFAHPQARKRNGKLRTRLIAWAKAAGLSTTIVRDGYLAAIAKIDAAATDVEIVDGEAAE